MGNMFSTRQDAVNWLVFNGWMQIEIGVWLKSKREATINPSPLNDGVVCVVTRPATWDNRQKKGMRQ